MAPDVDVFQLIKVTNSSGGFYNETRDKLRRYYRGNPDELLPEIFPQPASLTDAEYEIIKKYFVYVNLLKPSVARLVSGVYGNPVSRFIEKGSPYKAEVDEFLSPSRGYSIKVRDAFRNAVHYGTGVIIYTVKNENVEPYIPNPIYTRVFSNPHDANEIWAVIEEFVANDGSKQYRYTTSHRHGVMNEGGLILDESHHDLGVVPASIFYGEDQSMFGLSEGDSLVGSGAYYSSVVTRLLLNMVELVLTFTDPKGVLKGSVLNREEATDKGAIMEVEEGGDFGYASPDTNFRDLSETITQYLTYFCISEGIPLDALNPASVPENQSATSAKLRNQPLQVTISRLIEEQIARESYALCIVAGLYQSIETMSDVTFEDIRSKFRASIMIQPSGNPESQSEEAAAWQQLVAMGAKELVDAIRHYNPTASDAEIARRLDTFIAERNARGTTERDAQPILQPGKSLVEKRGTSIG